VSSLEAGQFQSPVYQCEARPKAVNIQRSLTHIGQIMSFSQEMQRACLNNQRHDSGDEAQVCPSHDVKTDLELDMEPKHIRRPVRDNTRMIHIDRETAVPKRPWIFTTLGERQSRRIPRGRVHVPIASRK